MLEARAASDTGLVRAQNEDYFRIIPEMGLFVLADGMGGARGGAHASRLAADTVVEIITAGSYRDAAVLVEAVEEANRRVRREAAQDPNLEGMGTTLVAALQMDSEIAIASVGDSRAWILDSRGWRAITEDQTWVQEVGRSLGLDDESLRKHPMRHVLTMAVGVSDTINIRYYRELLEPGALLLLSSDGLHGVIESDEIEKILTDREPGRTLEEKCASLIRAACDAGAPDNVTCVLIRVGPQELAPSI